MQNHDFKNGDIVKMSDWDSSLVRINDINREMINGYDANRDPGDRICRLATLDDVFDAYRQEYALRKEMLIKLSGINKLSVPTPLQERTYWGDWLELKHKL